MPPFGAGLGLIHPFPSSGPPGPPMTGLQLWLDGRTGISTVGSSLVWADQSGHGRDASQPNSSAPATGGSIAGVSALVFTFGQQMQLRTVPTPLMSDLVGAAGPVNPWTIGAVWQMFGTSVPGDTLFWRIPTIICGDASGSVPTFASQAQIGASSPALLNVQALQGNGVSTFQYAGSAGGPALVANPHSSLASCDASGNMSLATDFAAPNTASGAPVTSNLTVPIIIGAGQISTSMNFGGSISQICVWDHVLSGPEQAAWQAFITAVYGTLGP